MIGVRVVWRGFGSTSLHFLCLRSGHERVLAQLHTATATGSQSSRTHFRAIRIRQRLSSEATSNGSMAV